MHDVHPLPGTDIVVEGVRMRLVHHGRDRDPACPPVVLIHGLPTWSYLWRDVIRDMEHDHQTIAPDLIGLGHSERPGVPELYRLDAQARLLLRALDRLEVGRVVLVGHDLGGAVAVHATAQAAERVAGLVLIQSPLHPEVWPPRALLPLTVPGVRTAYATALMQSRRAGELLLRTALCADCDARELASYLAPLRARDGALGLASFARAVDMAAVAAAWERVRAIAPPALLLWDDDGTGGSPSMAYGRRLAAELPGAAWVPVGGGALLPHSRPERVAEEVSAFAAEVAGARAGV